MACLIREATPHDMPALVGLLRESDALHAAALLETFRAPLRPLRPEGYLDKLLAEGNGVILVAEQSGVVVGLVQAAFYPSRSDPVRKDRPYAVVGDLVVEETTRRTGVGRGLMSAAHDWARDRGALEIELGVWDFNQAAISLYESLGYLLTHRTMSKQLD